MKVKDLLREAKKELDDEKVEIVKEKIKGYLREMEHAKAILARVENQFQEFINKDIHDLQ